MSIHEMPWLCDYSSDDENFVFVVKDIHSYYRENDDISRQIHGICKTFTDAIKLIIKIKEIEYNLIYHHVLTTYPNLVERQIKERFSDDGGKRECICEIHKIILNSPSREMDIFNPIYIEYDGIGKNIYVFHYANFMERSS